MAAQHIFLFGDQADAPLPMVRRLTGPANQSKALESFLQSALDTVQLEVAKFTPAEQATLGSFHSLSDLTAVLASGSDRHGIAQMVLVFMARIGELILQVHAETNPALLGNSTPLLSLGICGGLLPAAAAAVATNVGELIEVASYLAQVNCRVAATISRRAVQVEDGPGSWAFSALGAIVPELPRILLQFHKANAIPRHRQAYIAISTPTWATVFGPPSVLKKLLENSEKLGKSDITVLPAFGAVHASHLPAPELSELLPENTILDKAIKPGYKLISGSTYAPFAAKTLRDLMPQIIMDIFQNSTNPAKVFDVGGSLLQKGKEVSLYMLASTSYLVLLRRSLHTQGHKVALKTNAPSLPNPQVRGGSGSVAIIGMSGQFPGAASVDEMWDILMRQQELHQEIPKVRFDADDYLDESARGPSAITTAFGCFLDNPGLFDHRLFNVSPREAMQMDPGQRLLMHATYTALEDAGVCNNGSVATDSRRIGTFIGDGSDDWRDLQQDSGNGVDKYVVQGTQRAFTPGRLNHHFKWEGATFCVDSACGSTASAVGLAYRSLVNRDCDTAIAGGSNIIATPFWQSALSKGGFLSTTGSCKSFRSDADGYCRGEAVGAIVLKRLEDAIQDNDNIISVIRSYARNHSAETVSITRPHVGTQERVFKIALEQAGMEPEDISYVEMHGTGTTAGDSAELESVANVIGQKGIRDSPLVVGAIKANLGHAEAASGISSIMKAATMFRKNIIPPQVGMPGKAGHYDCLESGIVLVPGSPLPFTRQSGGKKRAMLVNNFDAAGGNSSFVLEDPPVPKVKNEDPRSFYTVTVSANSATSLEMNKQRLVEFLAQNPQTNLADLSYTTTARRFHHSLRAAYSGSSIKNITDGVNRDLSRSKSQDDTSAAKSSRIVFAFTGQGAHYAGMGSSLFKTSSLFRTTIMGLQSASVTHGFPTFAHLISNPDSAVQNATIVQIHLALVALQIALVDLWRTWGITPDVVLGHSIGEYAALYAAGVLSSTDAMYLIGKRAIFIQNSCTQGSHGMLSISATVDGVKDILADETMKCELACQNSPSMIVLSGDSPKLVRIEGVLKERNIKCKLLDVPFAMHSRQMDTVLPNLREAVKGVKFKTPSPNVKVVSTLLGTETTSFDGDYLIRHTREPVKFQQAISHCFDENLVDSSSLWLEIGPNPICLGLARSNASTIAPDRSYSSLKKGESDWKNVCSILAACYKNGKAVNWRAYHQGFTSNLSHIDIPKYAFDTRDFWMTYKAPARSTVKEGHSDMQPISACLHHVVRQEDKPREQSATFRSIVAHPSLLQMIQGHKLSGIVICPAGVFSEMALTAARHLLTGGTWHASFPALSVLDTQIDHAIQPDPKNPGHAVQVDICRSKPTGDFVVTMSDAANLSVVNAKCAVRIRDAQAFEAECRQLLDIIQPKMAKLQKAASGGQANRLQGKLFYRLFANLMDYVDEYEGVKEAIVSSDFTEALASIRLPRTKQGGDFSDSCTLSPYWIDALTHLAGFLYNGNPMSAGDDVYIGTHMERMEIVAADLSPDVTYQSYAYIEHPEGTNIYRGHVYILEGNSIVGFLHGAHFRKMPRQTLHKILGKIEPKKTKEAAPKTLTNGTNGTSNTKNRPSMNGTNGTNGHGYEPVVAVQEEMNGSCKSLYDKLIDQLVEETGMEADELTSSTYFAEIGVDSLMSISILATLKAEAGVELNASFLMDYPTLGDAERQLRVLGKQGEKRANTNGHSTPNGHVSEPSNGVVQLPDCNIVLMQGPARFSNDRPPVFLIADGAGSAAAYIHFPPLGTDLSVFAVESPWVNDPQSFTCSFDLAAKQYLKAIRTKQPRGPYTLGGWSAGGVFAYEVARQLLEAGETVLGLFIIDITGPREEDRSKVASPTMDIIDQIGMLSGIDRTFDDRGSQSLRLKQHMLSTVTCFSKMDPIPMSAGRQPGRTFVIWAKKDVMPKAAMNSLPPGLNAWFYPGSHPEARPYGWDALVGQGLEISRIEGDHFSIMTAPEVTELGRVVKEAVTRSHELL